MLAAALAPAPDKALPALDAAALASAPNKALPALDAATLAVAPDKALPALDAAALAAAPRAVSCVIRNRAVSCVIRNRPVSCVIRNRPVSGVIRNRAAPRRASWIWLGHARVHLHARGRVRPADRPDGGIRSLSIASQRAKSVIPVAEWGKMSMRSKKGRPQCAGPGQATLCRTRPGHTVPGQALSQRASRGARHERRRCRDSSKC